MFKNISIKARLIFVLGLLSVLLMINGGFGLYGLNKVNADLQKVYEQDTANVIRLSDIERMILKNRIALFIATSDPSPDTIRLRTSEVEKNIAEMDRIWDEYMKTDLSKDDRALADDFTTIHTRFVQEGLRPAHEGPGQAHPLLIPAREMLGMRRGQALQAQAPQHVEGLASRLLGRHALRP